MEETVKLPTETITRKTVTVVVDGKEYLISTFKFAKTVRAFSYLTEVAAAAGLEDAVRKLLGEDATAPATSTEDESDDEERDGSEPEQAQQKGWGLSDIIGQLLVALPKLLRQGVPAVYALLGLIITPNDELKAMEKNERIDVDKALRERGRDLAYDGDLEEIMAVFGAAAQVIGVETILGNLVTLVRVVMPQR